MTTPSSCSEPGPSAVATSWTVNPEPRRGESGEVRRWSVGNGPEAAARIALIAAEVRLHLGRMPPWDPFDVPPQILIDDEDTGIGQGDGRVRRRQRVADRRHREVDRTRIDRRGRMLLPQGEANSPGAFDLAACDGLGSGNHPFSLAQRQRRADREGLGKLLRVENRPRDLQPGRLVDEGDLYAHGAQGYR